MAVSVPKITVPFPENYELIDAGGGKKLERWGEIITIRPERQAYFASALPFSIWRQKAHWEFIPESETSLVGTWKAMGEKAPNNWIFQYESNCFQLEITANKHLGIFPEQVLNWQFLSENLLPDHHFLNLFAYTGIASIVARKTSASVTHVDSSKSIIEWAKKNMENSELSDIRWVLEDARKFVQREIKRGNRYNIIQMDPPAWGIGAKKEKWKLEDLLPELIQESLQLLNSNGTLIISTYSPKMDYDRIIAMLNSLGLSKQSEVNEMWLTSTTGKKMYVGLVVRISSGNI